MNISQKNLFGHSYLLSRPYVYNGGLAAQILSNLIISDNASDFRLSIASNLSVGSYLTSFFFSTKSEVPVFNGSTVSYNATPDANLYTSIFGLLYISIVVLSCFLLGILWICWGTTQYLYGVCQERMDYTKGSFPRELSNFRFRSSKEMYKCRKKFPTYVLILCTLCHCLLALFIISFVFSLISYINLQQQIMSSTTSSSLPLTWQQSSNLLDSFYQMTNLSYNLFNQTINSMSLSLQSTLLQSLNNLTSDLFHEFGIDDLFTRADGLLGNLQNIIQSMQYISDNTNSTISTINYQKGYIQATVSMLRTSMARVCQKLVQNDNCLKFLNDSGYFSEVIDTNAINSDSSVAMLFMLNQLQFNITPLVSQISTMERNFSDKINNVTNQKVQGLNIQNSVKRIRSIWTNVSTAVPPWKADFDSLNSSLMAYANVYGLAFFVLTSILLIFVAVLIILYIILLCRYSLLYYFERKLISTDNKSPRRHLRKMAYRLRNNHKVGNLVVHCYVLIFSSILIITLVLSISVINVSHLSYNEACVQIGRKEGLLIVDNYLDIFLNDNWNKLIAFVESRDVPIQFTFPRPTNVLTNVLNNCTDNYGIFHALEMTNFVNISSFLWNPQNLKTLNDGLNLTYSTFIGINIKAMVPKDFKTFLASASNITSYFDKTNYQPTIDELGKGVIGLKNYSSWITSAILYFSTVNGSDSSETIRQLLILKEDVKQIQALETDVSKLNYNFQILQNRRNNVPSIQTLLVNLVNVENTLENTSRVYRQVQMIYTKRMLNEFPINAEFNLNSYLAYMFNHLFPCINVSSAVKGVLNGLCLSNGAIETMCTFGLNISVLCVSMMLMFQVMWKVIRIDIMEGKEENTSTC